MTEFQKGIFIKADIQTTESLLYRYTIKGELLNFKLGSADVISLLFRTEVTEKEATLKLQGYLNFILM